MPKLYSYVVRHDSGSAPNPFWGLCTLTICKPDIRRKAQVGDWVVGTGSKNSRLKDGHVYDLSDSVVYAMRITRKLTLEEYDLFCENELPKKIPNWRSNDVRQILGDCIYSFDGSTVPSLRQSVHDEESRVRDLSGMYSLISNHFYYFGQDARQLPLSLTKIIRRGQKHLVFEDEGTVNQFVSWISQFKRNKLYSDPQLLHELGTIPTDDLRSRCSEHHRRN